MECLASGIRSDGSLFSWGCVRHVLGAALVYDYCGSTMDLLLGGENTITTAIARERVQGFPRCTVTMASANRTLENVDIPCT